MSNDKQIHRALCAISSAYTPGRRIGSGSFGVVYEIFSVPDGMPYAAKFILPCTADDTCISEDAIRELRATTTHAASPHLITFERVIIFSNFSICFIMKRYDCTLGALLKAKPAPLPLHTARSVFFQLASAIRTLHGERTCHRDLKPENILVDFASGCVVVADLGVAKRHVEEYHDCGFLTGEVATCGYAPIETLLSTGRYSASMDIWSLGVILFELMVGKKPFPPCIDRALHAKVILGVHGIPEACARCATKECRGNEETCARVFLKEICHQKMDAESCASRLCRKMDAGDVDGDARLLVLEMLDYAPAKRPSVEKVLESTFLSGFVDSPDARPLQTERLPAAEVGAGGLSPALPLLSPRIPLHVLSEFKPKLFPCVDAPVSAFSWLIDCLDTKRRLLYLLDFFLHEHSSDSTGWVVEAWLLAIAASRLIPFRKQPEPIERLAAYMTYGLALATPSMPVESYNRFDWVDRIPVRVLDIFFVAREEARIITELCGRAPCIRPLDWKASQATGFNKREFFERTILAREERSESVVTE